VFEDCGWGSDNNGTADAIFFSQGEHGLVSTEPSQDFWAESQRHGLFRSSSRDGFLGSSSDTLEQDRGISAKQSSRQDTPMVAKHEGLLYVAERQKQQLNRTTGRLRQLNRAVLGELRRIERPNQTNKRYRDAGALFEMAASQVSALLRFREGILSSARDEPRAIVGRSRNAFPGDRAYCAREEVPPVNPAHYLELETLLEFVFRIGERLCARSIRSKNVPDAFVVGLRRLTATILKQQRHLRETTLAQSAVETEIRDLIVLLRRKRAEGPQPGGAPRAG
jgi:hypothetical protein